MSVLCSALSRDPLLARKPLSPMPTPVRGERDQKQHDPNNADDVRHPCKPTRQVAGVRPEEANSRSHDEQSDHRDKPVENPPCGDDVTLVPSEHFINRRALACELSLRLASGCRSCELLPVGSGRLRVGFTFRRKRCTM